MINQRPISMVWIFAARIFMLSILTCSFLSVKAEEVKVFTLENSILKLQATPDIGGRALYFGLQGESNFLRVSDEVKNQPHPKVTAESPNIGYFGMEIWLGPQSEWWSHQSVNKTRFAENAAWPPDPYLVQTTQKILKNNSKEIVLQSEASPVTGVSLTKTFQLDEKNSNLVWVKVDAKNERKEPVARDIWFNTRVFSNSHVYVPVASEQDVSTKSFEDARHASPIFNIQHGFVQLRNNPPPKDKTGRQGKLLIQPSEGWMAAFHDHQLFIIQFALQPKSNIHPEQGQVELFQCDEPDAPQNSVVEMEVHSPFKTLAPQEVMSAQIKWSLIKYNGEATPDAELKFLNEIRKTFK